MRRSALLVAGFAASVAGATALMLAPVQEYWRSESPDGAFVAVARTQAFYSMIPVMPGQGGDKPGRVTIYLGRQSCGSVWVPMVSMARDLRWDVDSRPRRAAVRLAATWNLDDCSLESEFGG